jgi:hypothetical protein
MFFQVFCQFSDQPYGIRLKEIPSFNEHIDKILITKDIPEFIKEELGGVAFEKERLVGIVHPEAAHFIEGKDGYDKYQKQQRPSKAQDDFCQTGKKGVGAAEILGGDTWIHSFPFSLSTCEIATDRTKFIATAETRRLTQTNSWLT